MCHKDKNLVSRHDCSFKIFYSKRVPGEILLISKYRKKRSHRHIPIAIAMG